MAWLGNYPVVAVGNKLGAEFGNYPQPGYFLDQQNVDEVPRRVVAWLGNTPVVAVGRRVFVAVGRKGFAVEDRGRFVVEGRKGFAVVEGRGRFVAVVGSKLVEQPEQSLEGPDTMVSFQGNFLVQWLGKCCELEALTDSLLCN